jgi:hypothetical protein
MFFIYVWHALPLGRRITDARVWRGMSVRGPREPISAPKLWRCFDASMERLWDWWCISAAPASVSPCVLQLAVASRVMQHGASSECPT